MRFHLLAATVLFATAFIVRGCLLQGLVLGDDPQELAALLHILTAGPLFTDQLHLRFAGWVFNHLAFVLLGVSEFAFLLPTWALTSLFSVLAYAILVRWGYGRLRALLGGLLVATAPFEVMLGTLRANDSYLELAVATGFAAVVLLEARPVWQGIVLAVCTWFGFYVKLFVVYPLPALGLYWLLGRRWRSAGAFAIGSAVLHGATCAFWKAKVGTYIPFLSGHAVNYAVPPDQLIDLFLKYPRLMFVGAFEFPTTLWGAVPFVLLGLLAVKAAGRIAPAWWPPVLRFDRGDRQLLALWGSFFFLLEFFPNGFKLDAYYTVPRIFRYLAPISFPIALHAAKLVLDLTRVRVGSIPSAALALGAALPALALNLVQSAEATSPSRVYREDLQAVLRDVREAKPPMLVAESLLASYLRDLYLDEGTTEVVIALEPHRAEEYERWLREHEQTLPQGTMLVTGLSSFVHYGAHIDGYRLAWFQEPLSPAWKLVREHEVLWYLPRPEPARVWRLERPPTSPRAVSDLPEDISALAGVQDPQTLFQEGMKRYDAGDYAGARVYFRKILVSDPAAGERAAFFYAASFFRGGDWRRARHEFKRFAHRYPSSALVPAAYWHLATCEKNLGHVRRARAGFASVLRRFPTDGATVNMASQELARLRRRHPRGLLLEWWWAVAGGRGQRG